MLHNLSLPVLALNHVPPVAGRLVNHLGDWIWGNYPHDSMTEERQVSPRRQPWILVAIVEAGQPDLSVLRDNTAISCYAQFDGICCTS